MPNIRIKLRCTNAIDGEPRSLTLHPGLTPRIIRKILHGPAPLIFQDAILAAVDHSTPLWPAIHTSTVRNERTTLSPRLNALAIHCSHQLVTSVKRKAPKTKLRSRSVVLMTLCPSCLVPNTQCVQRLKKKKRSRRKEQAYALS